MAAEVKMFTNVGVQKLQNMGKNMLAAADKFLW
jgi:hypothetical protein